MKNNKTLSGSSLIVFLLLLFGMLFGHGTAALAALGNETCSAATNLGNISLPFSQNASLDSTVTPDFDYYQITGATPGSQLSLTVSSVDPGNGILLRNPLVGPLNSNCTFINYMVGVNNNFQKGSIIVNVPQDGIVILVVTGWPDYNFTVGSSGGYRLDIKSFYPIGSISGTVFDATTNSPPLNWTNIQLYQCDDTMCSNPDYLEFMVWDYLSGLFSINATPGSTPFEAGTFKVVVSATGYQTLSKVFYVAPGQNYDLGILGLMPTQYISSISGTFVGLDSLQPLQGWGVVWQCSSSDCVTKDSVNWISLDGSGHFSTSQDWYGNPLAVGTYQIDIHQYAYPARYPDYLSSPFVVFQNQNFDMGTVPVANFPYIESISGRAVDAVTRAALSGTVDPLAQIQIANCNPKLECTGFITNADASGRFKFDHDSSGLPLFAGPTTVTAYATQYQPFWLPQISNLAAGENRNLGDLKVQSNPIRFSNVKPCLNIPSTGGKCRFSVTLTNGQANEVNGTVWSEINAYSIGSFAGSTSFSLGTQGIGFGKGTHGSTKTVSFELNVPGTVADYAWFNANVYIGQGSVTPQLQTIGTSYLFAMTKDPNAQSYKPVTENEGKELLKKSVDKLNPKPDVSRFRNQNIPLVRRGIIH